jgi:membrane protease YdiL (CAAX protease family)
VSDGQFTEVLAWIGRAVRAGLNRGAVTLLWLIVFGVAASESPLIGAPVLLVGLGAFFWLHVVQRRPAGWDAGRLGRPPISVLTAGVAVSAAIVAGDVMLVVYRNALDTESPPDTLVFRVAIILALPLTEEFGFRLWLQSPLERHLGRAGAVVAVALLFASFHSSQFPLSQFLGGCLYGAALVVTGSVWTPVLLHVFQNAALVGLGEIPAVEAWATAAAEAPPGWLVPAMASCWLAAAGTAWFWLRSVAARRPPAAIDAG